MPILLIMLAYGGVYSVINIFVPEILIRGKFQKKTGESFDDIKNESFADVYLLANRYVGIFALTTVISGFFVLFAGFRKKEKWAWWGFLAIGGIVWIWGLVNGLIIGDALYLILQFVGLALFTAGILTPVKVFFEKKA